jgi:hypothetical protein
MSGVAQAVAGATLGDMIYVYQDQLDADVTIVNDSENWEGQLVVYMRGQFSPGNYGIVIQNQDVASGEYSQIVVDPATTSLSGDLVVVWGPALQGAVGRALYGSLSRAVESAGTGEAVVLCSDVVVTQSITIGCDVFDLNGHSLTSSGGAVITMATEPAAGTGLAEVRRADGTVRAVYPSIAAAVAARQTGETVYVGDGTYAQ